MSVAPPGQQGGLVNAPGTDGDLTLTVNGSILGGWTDIRVTAGIERCPREFDIEMTDLYPGEAAQLPVNTGNPCTIAIGGTTVLTGYVNKVLPSYSAGQHSIRVQGRGKCQDLVDASAEWPSGQIGKANVLQIAQKLAQPYGITVSAPGGPGPIIPQFNLMIGETAYEIIERICRFAGLLCYEDASGNLVLDAAGTQAMASGIAEGQNLLEGHGEHTDDERYSEYVVCLMDMSLLGDIGNAGNLLATTMDSGVTRNRKHFVIADAGAGGKQIAQPRAYWERNRRWGRGHQITTVVDSWRDSAKTLWTPNRTAPVYAPNLKWDLSGDPLIADVTFLRDNQSGTRAEILLMPAVAFTLEPILLQPIFPDATPPTSGNS